MNNPKKKEPDMAKEKTKERKKRSKRKEGPCAVGVVLPPLRPPHRKRVHCLCSVRWKVVGVRWGGLELEQVLTHGDCDGFSAIDRADFHEHRLHVLLNHRYAYS